MPKTKVPDDVFLARILPCLNKPGIKWKDISEHTGLSIGACRNKLDKLRREGRIDIQRPQMFTLHEK